MYGKIYIIMGYLSNRERMSNIETEQKLISNCTREEATIDLVDSIVHWQETKQEKETRISARSLECQKLIDELVGREALTKEEGESLVFPIYMDNNATTRLHPEAAKKMAKYLYEFGNPHSRSHPYGWEAEKAVEYARKQIADVINAKSKEIIFTSGATESDNLAIKGVLDYYFEKGKKDHIITTQIEHKAVLDCCRNLEEGNDINVTYLPVKEDGLVDLDVLRKSIKETTLLVSIIAAHNEIGVIQQLKEIGQICKENDVMFHTDAAQAFSKTPLDVEEMNISLMSISSHKMHGPMGIGALYVRRKNPRVRMRPLIHGGGQERGMRSGTLPLALIVGFGEAAEKGHKIIQSSKQRKVLELRNLLFDEIKKELPDIVLNGSKERRLDNNLNISFPYVEGESIIIAIKDVAVSSGSACTSASLEPSYVLRALNVDIEIAHSSIRFSLSMFTTRAEVIYTANLVIKKIKRLLEMSPLYEMAQEGIDLKSIHWKH